MCILKWHTRAGHLQYLNSLDNDAADAAAEDVPVNHPVLGSLQRNETLPCELGIRYPTLQGILSGRRNLQTTHVSNRLLYELVYELVHEFILYLDRHMAEDPVANTAFIDLGGRSA